MGDAGGSPDTAPALTGRLRWLRDPAGQGGDAGRVSEDNPPTPIRAPLGAGYPQTETCQGSWKPAGRWCLCLLLRLRVRFFARPSPSPPPPACGGGGWDLLGPELGVWVCAVGARVCVCACALALVDSDRARCELRRRSPGSRVRLSATSASVAVVARVAPAARVRGCRAGPLT